MEEIIFNTFDELRDYIEKLDEDVILSISFEEGKAVADE